MNAHYFQHVPFEDLGSIRSWLMSAGYEITCTPFFKSADLPDPGNVDLLIVMGGPMSIHDEDLHPWLAAEKQFIRKMIGYGKPVLGICLGAQLIAGAMGAKVYPNPTKEIGWFPIEGLASKDPGIFSFPSAADVFHWHGETFDLPDRAVHLARSKACEHQAFQLGRSVIGLQFHLETTPRSAEKLVSHCRDELVFSPFIQSEADILAATPDKYRSANHLMDRMLSFLTKTA